MCTRARGHVCVGGGGGEGEGGPVCVWAVCVCVLCRVAVDPLSSDLGLIHNRTGNCLWVRSSRNWCGCRLLLFTDSCSLGPWWQLLFYLYGRRSDGPCDILYIIIIRPTRLSQSITESAVSSEWQVKLHLHYRHHWPLPVCCPSQRHCH